MRFENAKKTYEGGLVIRECLGEKYVAILCNYRDNLRFTNAYLSREDAALLGAELLRIASTRDETPNY